MRRIYRAQHLVEATHLQNVLHAAGIRTFLRNEYAIQGAGEIPFDQTWPELWVENDGQQAAALAILDDLRRAPRGPAWACVSCDEQLDGQFSHCWRCGAERAE